MLVVDPSAVVQFAPLAHRKTSFEFRVDAPLPTVAPLFGPEGERAWAGPEWSPKFIYPAEPRDSEGAVFTLAHGDHASVWVNTRFDLADGRMQYVVFVAGLMTTTIDVALRPDRDGTGVTVSYARTALVPAASAHVVALSGGDNAKKTEWRDAIAQLLRACRGE